MAGENHELALFAGAGGGVLGGNLLGWRTICYVERDPYCISVLKARIKDGHLDDAPIWDDIKSFDGRPWAGSVDIISAGFPCQPFSTAGKMRGQADDRNCWPETLRIIDQVRPHWCLLENVPGLLAGHHGYFAQILRDLASRGFAARWDCIPAAAVGAPHHRNRLWILAHTGSLAGHPALPQSALDGASRETQPLSPPDHDGVCAGLPRADAWFAYGAGLDRVADGVAGRVDRVRAIGNGQVPAVVRAAWAVLNSRPGTYREEVRTKKILLPPQIQKGENAP